MSDTLQPVQIQRKPRPAAASREPLTAEDARRAIRAAETALLDERRMLTADELAELAYVPDASVPSLAALAHEVRLAWCGPEVEVEGILSAKTGGCPEDCHFCSQSSKFDTVVKATPFLDTDEVLEAARETAALVPIINGETGLNVAVSAGILTPEQAKRLADGGVHRYNHNLETAKSYFPQVVTSHDWTEREDTCALVRENGMELCCGALLGMGESIDQRLELLGQLREVDPTEVPLNFLKPMAGTPFAHLPAVEPLEAIRWIAMFRIALPTVILRYAGGREFTLGDLQAMGMTSGINALIIGNYLTYLGRSPQEDLKMLDDLKMPVGLLSKVI